LSQGGKMISISKPLTKIQAESFLDSKLKLSGKAIAKQDDMKTNL